jgi:N6-adenosine-specific RNA methylase IME4/ParB-like chromosome segregation protein Spo0J
LNKGFIMPITEGPLTPTQAFHPLANLFPLLEGAEFDELVADVRDHGVREPIWIYEEKILDGRNRYRACLAAGVEPTFQPFLDDDPLAFVISLNLRRRHLSESQRAMVAAKLATLKDGQRADLVEGLPIGRASELLNVGERTVARAREVQERGALELVQAVERGEISVAAAANVACLSLEAQRELLLSQFDKREVTKAAKHIRRARAEARRTERIARIVAISGANSPLPQDRKYPVILADPPWKFEVYDAESGLDSAADGHYPTMELGDICALPVADLATPVAVLFMWTTAPHLRQSFAVLDEWGFEYVTHLVWVKGGAPPALGYWLRNQHEILIIGRRGNMPTPRPADRHSSVLHAPRREHSRKPDEAHELIERMYPELAKIELFARHGRAGWDCWGNEATTPPLACGGAA